MKIPIKIANARLVLVATFKHKRLFGRVSFYVDTGSQDSFINWNDALALKIPVNALPFYRHAKIGGGSLNLHTISDVSFTFRNEDNEPSKMSMESFCVSRNVRTTDNTSYSFPSILGLDFLAINKLSLYVNPANNIAYLEQ